ncbi:LPS biosynthesis protein WbpG [Schleiferia thermophila str. Yellowstone]|uniref:N-acetyl sugar amidotransferase n=1 Tax=Schleiferia thermophila TaxID=884107 RepID=UPI0004E61408|nr:N-acetyl sugar amidotransferase [Schleiferia thermophila]KFD40147.1 LPS biosynthesis protein WbpG [Schleiferia thermophila str. Yellowstone]
MKRPYQICQKTIMDTTDPNITFDENGISDYYYNFVNYILPNWRTDEKGQEEMFKLADKIRKERKRYSFDCIIGVSGGLDSSYTIYLTKEILNLRPLVFHVDAGWDTNQAVSNIERLLNGLNLDLYTEVINWEEMKDLQRSYFLAQVSNVDGPQDIAFFSSLYKFARKNNIKYVFTGANYSTECCREPSAWGAPIGIDKKFVKVVHKRFGSIPLKTFPVIDVFEYKLYYQQILGMKVVKPLNHFPFIKKDAEKLLMEKFGWQPFKHKHHESRFTRFYEDYWLPRKFGFHKRRAHFSSLILTGQMTREEALDRISKPELDEETLQQEFEYVANKLGWTKEEFQRIFEGENKSYWDYPNNGWLIKLATRSMRIMGLENRLLR